MPDSVRENVVFQCDKADEWIHALETLGAQDTRKFNENLFDIYRSYFSYEAMLKLFEKELDRINGSSL